MDEDITFVDHDESFLLRGGKVNTAFLHNDKLHISRAGTECMLDDLGIKVRSGCKSAFVGKPYSGTTNQPFQTPSSLLFSGHTNPLSSFYQFPFKYQGIDFRGLEPAYQFIRATHMDNNDAARCILQARRSVDAKRIGREIESLPTWKNIKFNIMDKLIHAKSEQCTEFVKALLESGDLKLVEDTDHEYWARGRSGNGQNKLGQILENHWRRLRRIQILENEQNEVHTSPKERRTIQ